MKRNYILSLLAIAMLVPFTTLKAQFHAGDSLVIQTIRTTNFTGSTALNWTDPDPANWLGVEWNTATPKRVIRLSLDADGTISGKNFHGAPGNTSAAAEVGFTDIGGVNASLTGAVDFSALAELKALNLKNQGAITAIDLTGLANFEHLIINNNSNITNLDFNNFPNLKYIHLNGMGNLDTLTTANCPNLLSIFDKSGNLDSVDIIGSDAIESIVLMSSDLTTIDVTGKTNLEGLKIQNSQLTSIVGIDDCDSLVHLRIENNNALVGDFDIADYNSANIYRINIFNTEVTSLTNWSMLGANTNSIRVNDANLTLSNATQIANEVTATNTLNFNNQTRWGGDTLYVGGSTNFPGEALIDINGVNVASAFTLFDELGTQVGASNATGVFIFPTTSSTGEYYVEMSNPGAAPANNTVNLRTNNFWVEQCPQIDTAASVVLSTITVGQSGATYQWLDCDNGNAVIAGATSQSYTATANGNYAVEMTLGGVCKDTSACVNISTVGLDELSSNTTVRAYPNPMNEQVTIELQKVVANTQVTIVNVEGKVVYNNVVNTGKISVDGSTWSNGIYIVKITNEEYTKTLKLIK